MKISYLALAMALGCAALAAPRSGYADPAAAPSAAPAASAAPLTVDTKNFAYSPDPLTVNVGDTVTFKNSDTASHTVTAADGSFDSGNMDQGATWKHVFKKAGTYKYICKYHSYMSGTIVVK